ITDEFGNFIFPAVYGSNTYEITVEASGYQKYTEVLEIRQVPVAVNTIMLSEKTPPPIKVTAMDLDMLAAVSWIEPGGMPENVFRYDDGTIDMQIGFEEPLPNSVMGAVFPSNSIVSSISWYLTDEEVHDSVKIIVFGLDMMGKPDVSRIYYQSGMIPNMDNQWNTIELHNYIDAPDGFFVGVSTTNQYISLGIDDGIGEPYEFKYGTYYVNVDWTTGGEWVDAGDLGCDRNMMIRANGYKFGMDKTIASKGTSKLSNISLTTSKANQKQNDYGSCQSETSSRSLENYRVYRLLKGDEAFEDEWDLLSVSFTDTFYEDFSWGFVEPGIYRFAIKAEYSGGLLSAARFSNEIEKK
ncbi:MAG: carboxypeptidase-like regulatory domain-containing protein, partial [Bacteroidales bacterium]|nr:carboxypeptidase-like regulatory domain-containing protein [Bacteroidales bacterium]